LTTVSSDPLAAKLTQDPQLTGAEATKSRTGMINSYFPFISLKRQLEVYQLI